MTVDIHQLTRQNADALPIYNEACRILRLPVDQRKAEIDAHPQSDRLAAEVKRVFEYRRHGAQSQLTRRGEGVGS